MINNPVIDNFGRPMTYLRLAVTDRCNLRCTYCMPEEGIHYLPKKQLLTYEEMERLVAVLAKMGINKVRITGGEPFLRKDLPGFLRRLKMIEGIEELNITTNGVLTLPHVPLLKELDCTVNLSLDTLAKDRFIKITRRDELEKVLQTLDLLCDHDIKTKVNMVVMQGVNTEDIQPMVELTKTMAISVRFIEEMPFNGQGTVHGVAWDHKKIIKEIKSAYPKLRKSSDPAHSTASHYEIPGHTGTIGIIAAYSRTFCGTCNRIRITAQGQLKTCLYDNGVLNLRDLMRNDDSDDQLIDHLTHVLKHRHKNGFLAEAARSPINESMSIIGG